MRDLSMVTLLALAALGATPSAFAASIRLNPGSFSSWIDAAVADGVTSLVNDQKYPTSMPGSGAAAASQSGNTSVTGYDLSNAGLNITFEHNEIAEEGSAASTVQLWFLPDSDVDYVLDGIYTAADSEGRFVGLQVQLYDWDESLYLFDSTQQSLSTPNESFTLGLEGGDEQNFLEGSLTGTLLSGHQYLFSAFAFIDSMNWPATTPATASGYVNLTFVPEPGTALLVVTGVLGIAASRRRRAN